MMAAAYYHTIGISRRKEFDANQEKINQLFKGWPRKREDGTTWPYAISHVNHPCTIWTRTSLTNFYWVLDCTKALCREFTKRYKNKHSVELIIDWMYENPPLLQDIGLTPFAKAMPKCYITEDAIFSYRRYYAYKTTYMQVLWNKIKVLPKWWSEDFIAESIETYIPNPA
jgi:hypothetical protein